MAEQHQSPCQLTEKNMKEKTGKQKDRETHAYIYILDTYIGDKYVHRCTYVNMYIDDKIDENT